MDLLRDAGLLGCKPSSVPLDPVNQLKQDTGNPMKDPSQFRRKIGRELYLCITRSDITFAVHKLSQYVSKPCDEHWEASEKILRYLKGTPGHGLFYSSDNKPALSIFFRCRLGSMLRYKKVFDMLLFVPWHFIGVLEGKETAPYLDRQLR
ncbi:uncharacterized mitochondrial protein AtMg00240-like [Salvia splendens]|uniref:uncharacterized mitochondrial protein AtMg00240-like n=1 Tax=Salvia splendens TaxID=180675 RepID=UPI001C257A6C|nr:uncharacterized mitochondrial protein AtMg00240-like [Salvia splendens]